MKKKKMIILLLILTFAFAISTTNVYAISCSKYTKKSTCKFHNDKCTWNKKTKTCDAKADGGASMTDVSNKNFTFCKRTAKIWRIVGKLFWIVKIIVPVILIIMGSIDFGKAVVSSKAEEITKAAKTFGIRVASGIIIFFVPTVVTILLGLIASFSSSGAAKDYEVCKTCIMNPGKCDTSSDASN